MLSSVEFAMTRHLGRPQKCEIRTYTCSNLFYELTHPSCCCADFRNSCTNFK
eukprot:c47950_g1_i1 orf=272-427(+)